MEYNAKKLIYNVDKFVKYGIIYKIIQNERKYSMLKFDKKYVYIILALVVVAKVAAKMTNRSSLLITLITTLAVLIAITFHEFAHAFAADKLGDDTPRSQGRLTLNPLAHIDLVGFLLLIVAGFGWGKPVQINPLRFKKSITMNTGEIIVSLAGPLMNFILAVISSIFMALMFKFNWFSNIQGEAYYLIVLFVLELVLINVGLGVFNLIPLPPLDGSKILNGLLPYNARVWFEKNSQIFYIVFVVIWISGLAGVIISPVIRGISGGLLTVVGKIFDVNLELLAKMFGL